MTNKTERVLLCCFAIPALVCLLVFFPQYNYAGFSSLVIVLLFISSHEMGRMVFKKKRIVTFAAPLLPFFTYFVPEWTEYFLCFFVILILVKNFICSEISGFENSLTDTAKDFFVMIYPSYLGCFIIKFISLDNINYFCILHFMLIVFANDTFAYVFGILLGKNNNGILKTSPKKSIAGFIGGFVSSVILSVVYFRIFANHLPSLTLITVALLTAFTAILGDLGDLIESVFKRSAKIKDSGTIIPGRGGVLDCFDSILTTAPLFYFVFSNLR